MSLDIARSDAARVAACVDLQDVRLWEVEADLASIPDTAASRLSYTFNVDLQVHYGTEESALIVLGNYDLTVRSAISSEDADGADPTEVASLKFQLNALFDVEHVPDGDSFSEDELNAFGETTGQFALYPYAREFIASMTGHMGLPPLHMGLLRLKLDNRDN